MDIRVALFLLPIAVVFCATGILGGILTDRPIRSLVYAFILAMIAGATFIPFRWSNRGELTWQRNQ